MSKLDLEAIKQRVEEGQKAYESQSFYASAVRVVFREDIPLLIAEVERLREAGAEVVRLADEGGPFFLGDSIDRLREALA